MERIKVIVDRRKENGLYWLTGSQYFPLMQGVSESLAGRVAIIRLLGLSQEEEFALTPPDRAYRPDRIEVSQNHRHLTPARVFTRIVRGTFPIFLHKKAPPVQNYYGSYLQTYIERDVRALVNITKLSSFEKFLRLAAARTGQILNLSELARDAEISVSTAGDWISILEASFQIFMLRPYFQNLSKRQIKRPKLYFLDTGLVCYLTGWRTPGVALNGAMAGPLFENYILTEILKSYWHRGQDPSIWFWRTKDRKEVNILLDEDGIIFPVEIKLTMRPQQKMIKNISSLKRLVSNVGKGAIICLAEQRYPLTRDVDITPAGYL